MIVASRSIVKGVSEFGHYVNFPSSAEGRNAYPGAAIGVDVRDTSVIELPPVDITGAEIGPLVYYPGLDDIFQMGIGWLLIEVMDVIE